MKVRRFCKVMIKVMVWACPAEKGGSGYSLQVLARIMLIHIKFFCCSLRAFRYYPSRVHH
jgi:hypothetical protein